MKYNEVVVKGRYSWQPERDSVTGALPPKQKVTVIRKTGIAAGGGRKTMVLPTCLMDLQRKIGASRLRRRTAKRNLSKRRNSVRLRIVPNSKTVCWKA